MNFSYIFVFNQNPTRFCFPVFPQIFPFDFGEDTINTGDSISLTCSINKGDLPIEITWLHKNNSVTNDPSIILTRVNKKISTLSIESVQAEHIGEYTCLAKNKAGIATHSTFLHVNGTYLYYLFFNSQYHL